MNIFIDFEATQPEKEIISIGAISENGGRFYSLVKPRYSKVDKYIENLTGITNEMLSKCSNIDTVILEFEDWLMKYCNVDYKSDNIQFICYGNDKIFVDEAIKLIMDNDAIEFAEYIYNNLMDYYAYAKIYFNGSISLINAFNYVKKEKYEQQHNALDDAEMLKYVFNETNGKDPLNEHPYMHEFISTTKGKITKGYNIPHGKFYSRCNRSSTKEREFESIDEAVDFIIDNKICKKDIENIHRDRIMVNIMRAIRTKKSYQGFYWRRTKHDEVKA